MFEEAPSIAAAEILQKNVIKVNEQGVEAATVTVAYFVGSGSPQDDKVLHFEATHPFLFVLRNPSSNAILYVGTLTHPTPATSTETAESKEQARQDYRTIIQLINPFWELSGRSILGMTLVCVKTLVARFEWDHKLLQIVMDHATDFVIGTADQSVIDRLYCPVVDLQTGFGVGPGESILVEDESEELEHHLDTHPAAKPTIKWLFQLISQCSQGKTLEFTFFPFTEILNTFPDNGVPLPNLTPFLEFKQLPNDITGQPLPKTLLKS
jgi:hypothetical protein